MAAADQHIDHRDDLYRIGCQFGQWFCRNGWTEDDCTEWLINQSPLRGNYTARQFEYQLGRAVLFAFDTYEDALASGGEPPPEFVQGLEGLADRVRSSKVRDKRYLLALIQHAINFGRNPVLASSRQVAALAGVKSHGKASAAMERWQFNRADGIVPSYSWDGEYGHSRLWTVDIEWGTEGYIYNMHGMYVPPSEVRLREWASEVPLGTEFTITEVSRRLNVPRHEAQALLNRFEDEFFGGGHAKGDQRHKRPAIWRRQPTEEQRAAAAAPGIHAVKAAHAARLDVESECIFVECGEVSPVGQRYCPSHERAMPAYQAQSAITPLFAKSAPVPGPG
jgi:hypothetical protein